MQNLRWNLPADKERESRLGGRIAASVVNYRQDNAGVGRRRSRRTHGFNCSSTMQNSELLARRSAMATIPTARASYTAVYIILALDGQRRCLATVFIRVSLLPCPSNRHGILDNASPALFKGSPSIHQQLCSQRNNGATLPAFMSTDNRFFEAIAVNKNV